MTRPCLAAVALALIPVPAVAAPADAGRPCGITATGLPDNHLGHETGAIHGGPWVVAGGDGVTVTCEIEYGNPGCYDTPEASGRFTSDPLPAVGLLPPVPLELWNPYQQAIYLGTTIRWTEPDGSPGERRVDADSTRPGDQCAVYSWGNEG